MSPTAASTGFASIGRSALIGFLNTHVSAPTGAHNAAAIAAMPHNKRCRYDYNGGRHSNIEHIFKWHAFFGTRRDT